MKDKVFTYAICISIGFHLLLLGAIGRTSAAKPIDVENLKLVRVDFVKAPDQVRLQRDEPQAKPEPRAQTPRYNPPAPVVPPVQNMKVESTVRPHVSSTSAPRMPHTRPVAMPGNRRVRMASATLPGDPGGELNLGSSSNHGDLSLSQGKTGVGYVPSPIPGRGEGSGTGVGKAIHQDPDPNASPGPGTQPAPAYVPPPPPSPRMVDVRVCAVSLQRPGPYCEKVMNREYQEGNTPGDLCDKCKAPEQKHESRLAESKRAELVRDVEVRVPSIVREAGLKTSVKATYTINTDGSVSDVEVVKSSGNALLDRAVAEAWSKLKYSPAMQDGVPRIEKKRRTFTYNGG